MSLAPVTGTEMSHLALSGPAGQHFGRPIVVVRQIQAQVLELSQRMACPATRPGALLKVVKLLKLQEDGKVRKQARMLRMQRIERRFGDALAGAKHGQAPCSGRRSQCHRLPPLVGAPHLRGLYGRSGYCRIRVDGPAF